MFFGSRNLHVGDSALGYPLFFPVGFAQDPQYPFFREFILAHFGLRMPCPKNPAPVPLSAGRYGTSPAPSFALVLGLSFILAYLQEHTQYINFQRQTSFFDAGTGLILSPEIFFLGYPLNNLLDVWRRLD